MVEVAVVGGGITGLAAAHRLVESGVTQIVLLEADTRIGGQIRTERHGEFLFEGGPDALVAQKPAGVALCNRIGLGPELRDLSRPGAGTQIWHRGRLHPVPDGFLMMAPTRLGPLLRSQLFSWRGKLRMLSEPFIPARRADIDDESLASFVERRLGREAFERVAEPVIGGLFTADAARLSLRMTMPGFLDMETRDGSVIRGLRRAATKRRDSRPFGHGTGRSGFVSIASGLTRIVEALATRMPRGSVRTGARVTRASLDPGSRAWSLRLTGGATIEAAAVVLACPGDSAASAVEALDASLADRIRRLRYASCATVHVVYRQIDVPTRLAGNGFFVPSGEDLPILACSYVSEKFEGRAPHGTCVFRAYVGGALDPEALEADDDGLIHRTHAALVRVLGISAKPMLARVHRAPAAMPQFDVGAKELITAIGEQARAYAGLFLAGSIAGAFGVPDCIRSGEDAAERAAAHLASVDAASPTCVAYQTSENT